MYSVHAMTTPAAAQPRITLQTLQRYKADGRKFAALTAYDYCSAYAASTNGVEVLLVGDSLGMVVQGHDSSLPVTIEDMAYHVRCVKRGNQGRVADGRFAVHELLQRAEKPRECCDFDA